MSVRPYRSICLPETYQPKAEGKSGQNPISKPGQASISLFGGGNSLMQGQPGRALRGNGRERVATAADICLMQEVEGAASQEPAGKAERIKRPPIGRATALPTESGDDREEVAAMVKSIFETTLVSLASLLNVVNEEDNGLSSLTLGLFSPLAASNTLFSPLIPSAKSNFEATVSTSNSAPNNSTVTDNIQEIFLTACHLSMLLPEIGEQKINCEGIVDKVRNIMGKKIGVTTYGKPRNYNGRFEVASRSQNPIKIDKIAEAQHAIVCRHLALLVALNQMSTIFTKIAGKNLKTSDEFIQGALEASFNITAAYRLMEDPRTFTKHVVSERVCCLEDVVTNIGKYMEELKKSPASEMRLLFSMSDNSGPGHMMSIILQKDKEGGVIIFAYDPNATTCINHTEAITDVSDMSSLKLKNLFPHINHYTTKDFQVCVFREMCKEERKDTRELILDIPLEKFTQLTFKSLKHFFDEILNVFFVTRNDLGILIKAIVSNNNISVEEKKQLLERMVSECRLNTMFIVIQGIIESPEPFKSHLISKLKDKQKTLIPVLHNLLGLALSGKDTIYFIELVYSQDKLTLTEKLQLTCLFLPLIDVLPTENDFVEKIIDIIFTEQFDATALTIFLDMVHNISNENKKNEFLKEFAKNFVAYFQKKQLSILIQHQIDNHSLAPFVRHYINEQYISKTSGDKPEKRKLYLTATNCITQLVALIDEKKLKGCTNGESVINLLSKEERDKLNESSFDALQEILSKPTSRATAAIILRLRIELLRKELKAKGTDEISDKTLLEILMEKDISKWSTTITKDEKKPLKAYLKDVMNNPQLSYTERLSASAYYEILLNDKSPLPTVGIYPV